MPPHIRRSARPDRIGYLFVLPFTALFTVFFLIPIVMAVVQSTMAVRRSGLGLGGAATVFAGLENYATALSDPTFWESFGRVLLFSVIMVPAMTTLATLMALLFDAGFVYARRAFQFISFAPYAVPGVIGAILWSFLYLPSVSPIVQFFDWLGVHVDFLSEQNVLWSIGNMSLWQFSGYNMLVVFAALQTVPRELYEAARMDGAGIWRIATSIKLPIIRPAIVLVTFFSIIGSLQLFSEPMVMRTIAPSVTATYVPNMTVYSTAFLFNNPNLASAMAVILAVITFVLSYGFQRLSQRGDRR